MIYTAFMVVLIVLGVLLLLCAVMWMIASLYESLRSLDEDFPTCRCGCRVLLGGARYPDGSVVHGLEICQPVREAL